MKKLVCTLLIILMSSVPVFSDERKLTEDYLKNKHHFSIMNPVAENIAQKIIKKSLRKETKGKYKVKLDGYTVSSLKKGIFKYIEIRGKNLEVGEITIPYIRMQSATDYNWVDYTQNPVVVKSDMTFDYEMHLRDENINQALETEEYNKKLRKVNKAAYPLLTINSAKVKIKNDKLYIIMEYNFPIMPARRNKTFTVSTSVHVVNSKMKLGDITYDKAYGNLPIDRIAGLINLIDPLSFTLNILDNNKCDGRIDSVKIEDDLVKINGRIFVAKDRNGEK